ncbi:NitT/TauT family transport system permease protein [Streptomyces sp. V4I8]|uniref:ABC transporter permease n=1 Tax=Streptomyces sp. V4I8 TaxID=3156469 RepID=UPI0035151C93
MSADLTPHPAASPAQRPGADGHALALASGLDALQTEPSRSQRRTVKRTAAPLIALTSALALWQLAYTLRTPSGLVSPRAVASELLTLWQHGILLPALGHSLQRCAAGFTASAVIGSALGLIIHRYTSPRTALAPVLSALQSLPASALVPPAVIMLGESETAVYTVVLLGAVPSTAMGLVSALDQIPPLLRRAGTTMGATGLRAVRRVLLPAALPGLIAALRQGWTFGWRALMTAELITATPLPGIGRILNTGRQDNNLTLVIAAVTVTLAVGVLTEVLIFAPAERRILHKRGLGAQYSR